MLGKRCGGTGKLVSYDDNGDVHFMQKRTESMGCVYSILDQLANPILFGKKLVKKTKIPGNYERRSLHAFRA